MIPENEPQNEEVNKQLKDLDWQGGGLATLAHWCAGLLLVAFSAGSLLSISRVAFLKFLTEWNAGRADLPDGISLLVNIFLVVAADVALLYAASQLRVLSAAGAPKEDKRPHQWAMWGASILEASTYLYLAWQYDQPHDFWLWVLVIGRAVGAPLFAQYLSMARPIPVGPRDVAYQASLASGKGLVRDVAVLAADPTAPLERKVRIYSASALMSPHDRARFDGIIEAVKPDNPEPPTPPSGGVPQPAPQAPAASLNPRAAQDVRTAVESVAEAKPAASSLYVVKDAPKGRRRNAPGRRTSKGKRDTSSVEDLARAVWQPGMSVSDMMAETSAINHGKGISRGAASKYISKFEAEQKSAAASA